MSSVGAKDDPQKAWEWGVRIGCYVLGFLIILVTAAPVLEFGFWLVDASVSWSADRVADYWRWVADLYSTDVFIALLMTLIGIVLTIIYAIILIVLLIVLLVLGLFFWVLSLSPITTVLLVIVVYVSMSCVLGHVIWVWLMPLLWLVLSPILKLFGAVAAYSAAGTIGAYAQHRHMQYVRAAMYGEVQARFQHPGHLISSLICAAISTLLFIANAQGWLE